MGGTLHTTLQCSTGRECPVTATHLLRTFWKVNFAQGEWWGAGWKLNPLRATPVKGDTPGPQSPHPVPPSAFFQMTQDTENLRVTSFLLLPLLDPFLSGSPAFSAHSPPFPFSSPPAIPTLFPSFLSNLPLSGRTPSCRQGSPWLACIPDLSPPLPP